MELTGVTEFKVRLDKLIKDVGECEDVLVGYAGVSYALFVHENLQARHAAGKQAQFLESPARTMAATGEFSRIVGDDLRKGGTMQQGLLLAGLRLQRESQKIVPIDTGNLRASAFTCKESQLGSTAKKSAVKGTVERLVTTFKRAERAEKRQGGSRRRKKKK